MSVLPLAARVLLEHQHGQELQRGAIVACHCGDWVGPRLDHPKHQAQALWDADLIGECPHHGLPSEE